MVYVKEEYYHLMEMQFKMQRLSKKWEKKSYKDIIKETGELKNTIRQEDYVYWDENAGPYKKGRWRAGRLAKVNTGQIVSARQAGGLKSSYKRLDKRLGKAMQFYNQKDITPLEAWKKSWEWKRTYSKAKKRNNNLKENAIADGNYEIINLNLEIKRNKLEYILDDSYTHLSVEENTGNFQLNINYQDNDAVNIESKRTIEQPIDRIYISNKIQKGKQAKLLLYFSKYELSPHAYADAMYQLKPSP